MRVLDGEQVYGPSSAERGAAPAPPAGPAS
jgi:hypothetical protein